MALAAASERSESVNSGDVNALAVSLAPPLLDVDAADFVATAVLRAWESSMCVGAGAVLGLVLVLALAPIPPLNVRGNEVCAGAGEGGLARTGEMEGASDASDMADEVDATEETLVADVLRRWAAPRRASWRARDSRCCVDDVEPPVCMAGAMGAAVSIDGDGLGESTIGKGYPSTLCGALCVSLVRWQGQTAGDSHMTGASSLVQLRAQARRVVRVRERSEHRLLVLMVVDSEEEGLRQGS